MRPRTCDHRLTRGRALRTWDAVAHRHSVHVCDRARSFRHEHIGKHVCGCGVKWA